MLAPCPLRIDTADVRAYLDATGESPERWAETVPPLAVVAFTLAATNESLPLPRGTLHAGQEFEFFAPVEHGAPLSLDLSVAQHEERRGALFVTFALELHDGDRVAMRGRTSLIVSAEDAS